MDDADALELIDAHLDLQDLSNDQVDALTVWLRENPQHADQAFHRIFLHTYLRQRLQAGTFSSLPESGPLLPASMALEASTELLVRTILPDGQLSTVVPPDTAGKARGRVARHRPIIAIATLSLGIAIWWICHVLFLPALPSSALYAYEGFDYAPTPSQAPVAEPSKLTAEPGKSPVPGGMQDLRGGPGWSGPWRESGSRVAIILSHPEDAPLDERDMRKFGPLGYSDSAAHVLLSTGNQMRTAAGRFSVTTRQLDVQAFPRAMSDEGRIGRDGTVLWFSFLAQSFDSRGMGRFVFLQLGTEKAGYRIGKLASVPSGNWSVAGLLNGAEVNLRSSAVPSGESAFLVTRLTFRPGPEHAEVWINPQLGAEPPAKDATLHLPIPDFRFDELAITSRYSTDIDEIRFGGTFHDVAPTR